MPWVRFNTETFSGEPVPAEELPAYLHMNNEEEGGATMACGGKKGGKKPPKK